MKKGNNLILSLLSVMLLAVLALEPSIAFGQNYHTDSKKAVKLYKKGRDKFIKKDYAKAQRFIDKSIDSDKNFVEALQMKGEIGMALEDADMAVTYFEKSLAADSMTFPGNAIKLANLYNDKGDYSSAIKILKWYCGLNNQKEDKIKSARDMLANAEFREDAVNHPVAFNPVNLGENINTDGDEYVNQILPDGSRIYFTRRTNEKDADGFWIEEEYYSSILDSQYLTAVPMNLDWKNKKRMGAVNISADQSKMYFVGFDWIDSRGRGDIYVSEFEGPSWGKPVNVGSVVNTSALETQPFVNPKGDELYFTRSSRTYGTDIYMTKWFDGKWTNPTALTNVNSKGNEMSPFIHPDGKTLYFASDGFPGMGGYDIFMCKRNEKGEWSEPKNLGYPLNTTGDEICFSVSSDGKTGYISSIREGGFGGYDIYSFELDSVDGPEPVEVRLFVLSDIKFDINRATLDATSFEEIDRIAAYLTENPDLTAEIAGYTDDSGEYEYNMTLSQQRAESVKAALVERDIANKRITTKGYGENHPIVPNDSDEHRAMNRRVEMRVF